MSKRPASIDVAIWLLWGMILAGLTVSVLVVVYRDDLEDAWSPGRSGDSTVQPLEFVPVILVLYLVIAVTAMTLIPLLRHGHNWARHSLAGMVLGILVGTLAIIRTTPPALFRGCTIAAAVLSAVTLVFLWHPDSRRYCLDEDEDEVEVEDDAASGRTTRATSD